MHPALAMSFYRYFKPTLPSPSGPSAESINPATIKAANEAVKDATSKPSKARGSYRHVDAETQAKIAQYACEHGNKAAMERFSTLLGFDIKKSSASTWKMKYLAEIKRRVKTCARVTPSRSSVRPKFKNPKFYSKGIFKIIRIFGPPKITRYKVYCANYLRCALIRVSKLARTSRDLAYYG